MRQVRYGSASWGLCGIAGLCALAISAAVLAAPARGETEDPIDQALDACLATDQGQTNAGMIQCTSTAITAWNDRLNQTYKQVMAGLDPKSSTLLRSSERDWVAFRTAERAAQAGPWHDTRGSDVDVEILGDDLSAIRERVGELKTYLAQG